ncbi:MAG: hypothetical protein P9X24_11555 [Candidatus Hatepunaea meridiana]|nr:hypothetical protein [Candidatus Hatepunaea meridiana]
MNKTRWLALLLLASWTLNVAIVVAYFLKTSYPPGVQFTDTPGLVKRVPPMPGIPKRMKAEFHAEAKPMHIKYARLIGELSLILEADELDTAQLYALGDSLIAVRSELQRKLIKHLGCLQQELPPEGRRRLSRHIFKMMDGHMPDCKPGFNMDKRHKPFHRFRPDSIKN